MAEIVFAGKSRRWVDRRNSADANADGDVRLARSILDSVCNDLVHEQYTREQVCSSTISGESSRADSHMDGRRSDLPILRRRVWRIFRRGYRHFDACIVWVARVQERSRNEYSESRAWLSSEFSRSVIFCMELRVPLDQFF